MTWEHELFSKPPELYQQYDKDEILKTNLSITKLFHDEFFIVAGTSRAIFLNISVPDMFLFDSNNPAVKDDTIRISKTPSFLDTLITLDSFKTKVKLDPSKLIKVFCFAKAEQDKLYTFLGQIKEIQIKYSIHESIINFTLNDVMLGSVIKSLLGFEWEIVEPYELNLGKPVLLHTYDKEKAKTFANKLVTLFDQYGTVRITRFDGQKINVYLLDNRGVVLYESLTQKFIYANDPNVANSTDEIYDPFCDYPEHTPLSETIPREDAIKAMKEFIDIGKRPTCVQWRE
jgi:GTPase SAR1 family protein